jgi:type IV pilus assembly protein PilV
LHVTIPNRCGCAAGRPGRLQGFSLIEVLVALIVLSVGLLGIARMQSLALSSTSIASQRALAAIEAESLAAAMHANRGYWTVGDPAGSKLTIQGATFTYNNGFPLLSAAGNPACNSTATPCTPTQLAAHDLKVWATGQAGVGGLQALLPGDTAVITCGALTPLSCTITISWVENAVAVNSQEAAAEAAAQTAGTPASMQNPVYTLYVEP